MNAEPITLDQQAKEADLSVLEYEGWIRQIAQSKDTRVDRSPEKLASMRLRLEWKRAIAETIRDLAERAARRAQRDAGRDAA